MLLLYLNLLFDCWIIWFAFSMTSPISAHFHKEDQLLQYARLSQQLRREMKFMLTNMTVRLENIKTNLAAANIRARDQKSSVSQNISHVGLVQAGASVNLNYALIVSARSPTSYHDATKPVFSFVLISSGLGYNTVSGEVKILVTGIYMLESRAQMREGTYASNHITVYNPDGQERLVLKHNWYRGCFPYIELIKLEAGSVIRISGLKPNSIVPTYDPDANSLITGIASQLSIRYLGSSSD